MPTGNIMGGIGCILRIPTRNGVIKQVIECWETNPKGPGQPRLAFTGGLACTACIGDV